MNSFLSGLLLGGSLIVAIGSQNAFVLKQGLLKNHVFKICLVCAFSDAFLMVLGVLGVGTVIESNPKWLSAMTIFGATYLFIFGVFSFRAAFKGESLEAASGGNKKSAVVVLGTVLALTFLNPHVYLDTVLLIGSIAASYAMEKRTLFISGAIAASFIWFFSLGYGARLLAPMFAKPAAWRVLNIIIGIVMWLIAYTLVM